MTDTEIIETNRKTVRQSIDRAIEDLQLPKSMIAVEITGQCPERIRGLQHPSRDLARINRVLANLDILKRSFEQGAPQGVGNRKRSSRKNQ